ncbi:MAG: CBU_0592 family membrane protein [Steroidobacteraceae bacterium]
MLILVAYFLLQIEKIENTSLMYSVSNAVGAVLILVSLYFDFNLSAFQVEFFWFLISVIGLVRYFARRQSASG